MTVIPIHLGGFPLGRIGGANDDGDSSRSPGAKWGRSRIIDRSMPAVTQAGQPEIPVMDRTDESLVSAYLDGERDAFREILHRYRDELIHFLTRFLGSRAAAEDVFQETFLQVHLSAETFDPSRRFKPWLFTIAANKGRDYHRKHGRRSEVSLSNTIGSGDEGQRYVDLMEANVPGPDAPVLDAERSRMIKSVVDDMPTHLREILLLSYFQRMSYAQISEALEIPLGTVKSRLHTAVASFARAWEAIRGREGLHDEMQDGRQA